LLPGRVILAVRGLPSGRIRRGDAYCRSCFRSSATRALRHG
jgi:hypothetical protein